MIISWKTSQPTSSVSSFLRTALSVKNGWDVFSAKKKNVNIFLKIRVVNYNCSQNSCRTLCLLDDKVSRNGPSDFGPLEGLCCALSCFVFYIIWLSLHERSKLYLFELTVTSFVEHRPYQSWLWEKKPTCNFADGWLQEKAWIRAVHPLQASTKPCLSDRIIDPAVWRTDRSDHG